MSDVLCLFAALMILLRMQHLLITFTYSRLLTTSTSRRLHIFLVPAHTYVSTCIRCPYPTVLGQRRGESRGMQQTLGVPHVCSHHLSPRSCDNGPDRAYSRLYLAQASHSPHLCPRSVALSRRPRSPPLRSPHCQRRPGNLLDLFQPSNCRER
jgi:hypothetical protein